MPSKTHSRIEEIRTQLGANLTIVGHHYQSDEIIQHVDVSGDSLELSRKVAGIKSEHIVFCGVHFMAESAALLARPGQKIYLPAPDANCVMAKMVPATLLDRVINKLISLGRSVLPVAYVNTSLAVKAVVGKHGGVVCTSANAETIMRWAFEQGKQVLFLPDKNLGRNTAKALGIDEQEQHILDISSGAEKLNMANTSARLLFWPGLCAIHARFKVQHIAELRTKHPDIKIAVHPECPPEIVTASDAAGSTSFLIKYVADAPAGSVIGIGTEASLVNRLANEYAGNKKVIPLHISTCSDMAKTTPEILLTCLEGIAGVGLPPSPVPTSTPLADEHAKSSLERMLEICK